MASAPFPGEESYENITQPIRRAGFVRTPDGMIRGLVPSFYEPHQNLDLEVKVGGMPLLAEVDKRPFTIGEVPIELRWAIHSNGEVLDQNTFNQRHAQWYEDYFAQIKVEDPSAKPQPQPYKNFPVPNVVQYVSQQVDAALPHRYVPMHYDQNRTAGSKPEFLEDQEGNREPRMDALRRAYRDDRLRHTLTPDEIRDVEESIGGSDFKTAREIELEAEIARLTADKGMQPPAPEPDSTGVAPPVFRETASCGKEFTSEKSQKNVDFKLLQHKRYCKKGCQEKDRPTGT